MEIIVGVLVAIVVQFIKVYAGTSQYKTLALVAGFSLLAAFGYHYLVGSAYWETVKEVLTTAGAFYVFIIKRFEPKPPETPLVPIE